MEAFNQHIPVMLNEVISFVPKDKKITYLDLTLGRGGHANAILQLLKENSTFYGVDRDIDAINYCQGYLAQYQSRIHLNFIQSNYAESFSKINTTGADFILMDIGVSSPQFDNPLRGFSYRYDAELDMRMNQNDVLTAKEIINSYDEKELIRVFKELGECEGYYPVVKKILKVREEKTISTTFELVDIIKSSLPYKYLKKDGHPAKQFFLGLRYEVNDEINQLTKGLKQAIDFLNPKGRLVIISFNSEEDRVVKNIFKSYINESHVDKYSTNNASTGYIQLTKKPLTPTKEEITINNRSKPSILRAIERI